VVAEDQFDAGWRVENAGERTTPRLAFGYAISSAVEPAEVRFEYIDQWVRTIEMSVLGVLWLIALWVTRKPGSS
jgi:hypothetical protein